jgi:hypothetical protein
VGVGDTSGEGFGAGFDVGVASTEGFSVGVASDDFGLDEDFGMSDASGVDIGVGIGGYFNRIVVDDGDVDDFGVGVGEVDEDGVGCFPSKAATIATTPPPLTSGTMTYRVHHLMPDSSTVFSS